MADRLIEVWPGMMKFYDYCEGLARSKAPVEKLRKCEDRYR